MSWDSPRTIGIDRRSTIKRLGATVCTFGLPTSVSQRQPPHESQSIGQRGNLLPADQADTHEPRVHRRGSDDAEIVVTDQLSKAYEPGLLQVMTGGRVNGGKGQLAMDGMSWVESKWTPPDSGQYYIKADYTHASEQYQSVLGNSANNVLTSEPTVVVVDDHTGSVVSHSSEIGSNAVSTEVTEEVIERLITRIATYILFPGLGLVGRIVARFLIGPIVDHLIDLRPRDGPISNRGSIRVPFSPDPEKTYRVRFIANNGFSSETRDRRDTAMAESSSFYELKSFSVDKSVF